jgi:hypothetical protein
VVPIIDHMLSGFDHLLRIFQPNLTHFLPSGRVFAGFLPSNIIHIAVDDAELARRRADWVMTPYKATRGRLHKDMKTVRPASDASVTGE